MIKIIVFFCILFYSNVSVFPETWEQTTSVDFNTGTAANTGIIGSGESASVKISQTGGWFNNNSDWQNRKRVKIVNSTSTLVDFQVYLTTADLDTGTLITGGKLQSDYRDIRFTDEDGITSLNYWVYPSTEIPADVEGFWIRTLTLGANSIPGIFMYYNNASTVTTTSFDNTMQKLSTTTAFGSYYDGRIAGAWNFDGTSYPDDLLVDGGLENWTSATDLTSWTEVGTDGSTRKVSEESGEIYSGSRSVKLEAIGSVGTGTTFYFSQPIENVIGQEYQFNFCVMYSSRIQGNLEISIWDTAAVLSMGYDISIPSTASVAGLATSFKFISHRFTGSGSAAEIRISMGNETYGYAYFDDISVKKCDSTVDDISTNNNNGTITGASFTGSDGGRYDGVSTATVKFATGDSLQFDGVDDKVSVGDLGNFPEITISWWRNANSYTIPRYDIYDTYGLENVTYSDGGKVYFYLGNGSVWSPSCITNNNIQTNRWYHFAISYDGSLITLYVDGVAQADTEPYSETVNLNGLNIGSSSSNFFDGTIDEVAIYNVALSSGEIKANYERRKYANPEPVFSSLEAEEDPSMVSASYYSNGTYISASYDAGTSSYTSMYETLSWNPESQPSNTKVKFQIATNDDNETWVFRGSDGNMNTYYTSAGTIWSGHDGDRYIKYKAYFTTDDGSISPEITDVSIKYSLISSVVSSVVNAGQAGEINAGAAKLIIPVNTIFRNIKYTITEVTEPPMSYISEPMSAIVSYDFQAEDAGTGELLHSLDGAVTIELRAKSKDNVSIDNTYPLLALTDAASNLALAYWTGRDWTIVGGDVTVEGNTAIVSKKVSHFTKYGVVVKSGVIPALKIAPNPFTPCGPDPQFSKVCFTFPNDRNEEVELKIYDILARLVKEISIVGVTSISWDGKNRHDEIAEDGIYIYQLKVGDDIIGKGTIVLAK